MTKSFSFGVPNVTHSWTWPHGAKLLVCSSTNEVKFTLSMQSMTRLSALHAHVVWIGEVSWAETRWFTATDKREPSMWCCLDYQLNFLLKVGKFQGWCCKYFFWLWHCIVFRVSCWICFFQFSFCQSSVQSSWKVNWWQTESSTQVLPRFY